MEWMEEEGGDGRSALRLLMREALERLGPEWLEPKREVD